MSVGVRTWIAYSEMRYDALFGFYNFQDQTLRRLASLRAPETQVHLEVLASWELIHRVVSVIGRPQRFARPFLHQRASLIGPRGLLGELPEAVMMMPKSLVTATTSLMKTEHEAKALEEVLRAWLQGGDFPCLGTPVRLEGVSITTPRQSLSRATVHSGRSRNRKRREVQRRAEATQLSHEEVLGTEVGSRVRVVLGNLGRLRKSADREDRRSDGEWTLSGSGTPCMRLPSWNP